MRLLLGLMFLFVLETMAQERFKVAFAQDTMGNDWRVAQVKEVENAIKKYKNVDFFYTNGKGDTATQIRNIEQILEQKVDLLITSPRGAKLMTPIISKVYKSGTPVVLLSRTIMNDNYSSFLHPDNRLIAAQAARYIAKRLNNKGNVFILQHTPSSTPGMRRTEGFMNEIKKYPNIKIVGMKVANSQRAEAIIQTEKAIEEGLKFDAIYAQSDSMAIGAIRALKKHNIDPKSIVITGIDYISQAQELIRKGELDASYVYPTAGKQGVDIAMKILNKKKFEKEIIIPSTEVTKKNVEKVQPIF